MLYGEWIERYEAKPTEKPVTLPAKLQPLVYTYLIRYEFAQGLEHVVLARGALSGMAESVYLQDGRTGDETATILFEGKLKGFGVEARVKSFEFDVTEQVAAQPRGGVITVAGLAVTDDEAGGDAGFEVEVDGWGPYEDIELPLD